jgi:hypothetical protein
MKNPISSRYTFLLSFVALWIFSSGAVLADEAFNPLFNGADLSGWDGKPGAWEVRDGEIWCTGKSEANNWLIYRESEPADFILKMEFRWDAGNSGVQVRSDEMGADWQIFGYQVEIAQQNKMGLWHHSLLDREHPKKKARHLMTTAGEHAVISEDGSRENTKIAEAETIQAHYQENEWNTLEIEARGNVLIQRINGIEFSKLTDHDSELSRRKGFIALQDHGKGCKVAFRKIQLKILNNK